MSHIKCINCLCENIDLSDSGENYEGFKYNKVKCSSCNSYVHCKWCYENKYFKAISFLERIYCQKCKKTYCEYDNLPLYTGSCMVYKNCQYKNDSKENCNIDIFYRYSTFINNLHNGLIKVYDIHTGYNFNSIHKTYRIKYKYEAQVNDYNIQYLKPYESTSSNSEINHIPSSGPFIYYQGNQPFLKGTRINGVFVDKFYYYDNHRYFTIEALKLHHKGNKEDDTESMEERETYFEANEYEDHLNGYDNTDFRLCKYETTFKIMTYPKNIDRSKLEYYTRFLYTCHFSNSNHFSDRDNSKYKYIEKLRPYYNEMNDDNLIHYRIYNNHYHISAPCGPFILYSKDYIPYFKVDYKIMMEDGYEMSVFDNVLYEYNKHSGNYELTKRVVFKDGKRNGLYYEHIDDTLIFCNYVNDKIEGKYYKCKISKNKAEKHIFNYDNVLQFQKKKKIYKYDEYENDSYFNKKYLPKKDDYSVCSIEEDAQKEFEIESLYRELLIKKYIYEKKNELYEKIFEVMTVNNFKDYFFKNDTSIITECNYVNGKINGVYQEYYIYNDKKYLSKECFYNNGNLEGDYKTYSHQKNGRTKDSIKPNNIQEHIFYKNNKIIDFHRKYYHVLDEKNSSKYNPKYIQSIESEILYDKDGISHGLHTFYYHMKYNDLVSYNSFEEIKENNQNDDEITKEVKEIFKCDDRLYMSKIKYTILYDKGAVLEKKYYYENGVIEDDCIQKNISDYPDFANIENYIKYDKNKDPYAKEEKKAEFEKLWEKEAQYVYLHNTYYENGTKRATYYTSDYGNYKKIGSYIEYYENGKLKEKGNYICIKSYYGAEEKKIGSYIYFYDSPKNNMEKEEIYDENGKRICIKKYNKSGKLTKEEH